MVKNTTEYLQVGITPELKDKVNKFCSVKGNTKNKLINDLLQDFFNNKIVSNDYIKLKEPLYFNIQDLLNNKSVICTNSKPTSKFNEFIKIVNVPNNLDSYNKNYNSYCSDAPNHHKGILINSLLDENHENLFIHYLGFEFIINDPDYNLITNSQDTLKISLINETELLNVLNMDKHKEILKEFKAKEKELKEAIRKDNATNIILNNELNNNELKPDVKKEFENKYKFAMFRTIETENNNFKALPLLLIENETDFILYGNKLIKTYENYFYLRPFYLDVFINNLIYLMENNTEINNYIQECYIIGVNDLKEFQSNYKFNPRVYFLINSLKPSNKNTININVLFDSHINNINLDKAITNHFKYNNIDVPKIFKVDL